MPPALTTYMETDRLILRPYQIEDAALYYQISQRNRHHLARYESGNALMWIQSEEEAGIAIQRFKAGWESGETFFFGAYRKDTREFVAQVYIGLSNRELPEYEIGYIADVDQEGKGYVTEAVVAALPIIFEQLGAQRVRLECDDTNLKSLQVAERCGFVREGHIRENRKNADGSLSGTLNYGLLRREFNAQGLLVFPKKI